MKKLLSIILSLAMLCTMSATAFAEEASTTAVAAKGASVTNVAEDGSNLTDDKHLNSNTTIQDISLNITTAANGSLQIAANVNNDQLLITGTPAAKSENQHAIFFTASSSNSNYEVVNMEYVDNAQTNMFFKNYGSTNNVGKILKLYLKDLTSETRDYIIIECFDYTIKNFDLLVSTLPQNTVMGAWVAKEFSPASTTYNDLSTYTYTSNIVRTYTMKYYDFSFEQTHTITIAADATYSNIRVGQMTDIIYRIGVIGKTMVCPGNPSLNSSTESYLHVDAAALRQTTVPNTAFVSTSIDGYVKNNNWGSPSLSASIGVSLGVLGVSLSVPISYSGSSSIDIDDTYESYVNGRNGQYTRSIRTAMKSNYRLTQIGHYFEVRSTIADFGNVAKSSAYHKATWDLTIINGGDFSTQAKIITQNVLIAIQN